MVALLPPNIGDSSRPSCGVLVVAMMMKMVTILCIIMATV